MNTPRASGGYRRALRYAVPSLEDLERRRLLSSAVDLAVPAPSDFLTVGDFNRDGLQDVVASSYTGGALFALFGAAGGGLSVPQAISMNPRPDHVTSADLNGDGHLDLLVTAYDDNSANVLLGDGSGGFGTPIRSSAGNGPLAAQLGDFDGDGRLDAVLAKTFDRNLTLLPGRGDGSFEAPRNLSMGDAVPNDLTVGDFNGDGKLDVAAIDYFLDRVQVFSGDGQGNFTPGPAAALPAGPTSVDSADVTGDGTLDLVIANFIAGSISLLSGNGDGTFAPAQELASAAGATHVLIHDLDADGRNDISVAAANADELVVLRGNGGGAFEAPLRYPTATLPRASATGDFDQNGLSDVIVANQGEPLVTAVYDAADTTTVPPPSAADLAASSDTGVSSSDNVTRLQTLTFTGTAVAESRVDLYAGTTLIGSENATSAGAYAITAAPLPQGTFAITAKSVTAAGTSPPSPATTVTIDLIAPALASAPIFGYESAPHRLSFAFSEDVGPSLSAADFTVERRADGEPVAAALSYAAAERTATLSFPQFPGGVLPEAGYRATLAAVAVTDVAGNPLAAPAVLDFTFLRGDANGDGRVNLLDFNVLAHNFSRSDRNFAQGDFNYDGVVNLADFNALAVNFGGQVLAPGSAAGGDGEEESIWSYGRRVLAEVAAAAESRDGDDGGGVVLP